MSKNLKKVCVCGHFGFGENLLNGQTVKTKILTTELERSLGEDAVIKLDTHGGKKKILSLPFSLFGALRSCKNIVILPAHNGLRLIAPILAIENLLFRRKLHYAVIGGWLAEYLQSHKIVAKALKKFHGIYVETNTMKRALLAQGYENVEVMPNCKELTVLEASELKEVRDEPYRLCTFSRVMKEKGIEDAIEAVRRVNEQYGRVVFSLDIYGQIDSAQVEWFDELQKTFPSSVRYGGLVAFDRSVEVLKDYFALLFPTRFFTEGIPGTIIDAYSAGIPVISSRWESFADMVEDGVTGIGYEFADRNALTEQLLRIAEDVNVVNALRANCLERAKDFLPSAAIAILLKRMD